MADPYIKKKQQQNLIITKNALPKTSVLEKNFGDFESVLWKCDVFCNCF